MSDQPDKAARMPLPAGPLTIERSGDQVSFIVQCSDDYSAIKLYNQATAEARAGRLDLHLVLNCTRQGNDRGI